MIKKRGQISIFIIIAVVVVGAVIVFLLFGTRIGQKIGIAKETNPESFLDSCLGEKTKEAIEIISLQGGHISNPLNKSFLFKDEKFPTDISYLCYNKNDYFLCVNQEPMLFQHLKEEIKDYISNDVENCFNSLASSLEKQGYEVGGGRLRDFEVKLEPKKVIIETNSEFILTKTGETSKQENFKVTVGSRLYELAEVVNRIVNGEATACNFDYVLYMMNNPEFDIDKFKTADSTEIYVVRHEDTNERFNLAIRGCVMSV